jgi:hypothetical protein
MSINYFSKKLLYLLVVCVTGMASASAQDSTLIRLQRQHKSREYLSVDLQPLLRTGTTITKTSAEDVFNKWNVPGFAFGVDYNRVSNSGFTITSGIHFRIIPVSWAYNQGEKYFGKRVASFTYGHFYFPVQIGYTLMSSNRKWHPSFMAGVNAARMPGMWFSSSYSSTDNNNVTHSIQEIILDYPERLLWIAGNVTVRASRTLRRGNQMYFGITANLSDATFSQGTYEADHPAGRQSGIYTDNGSYLALQFGFSFVRKYKQPETY